MTGVLSNCFLLTLLYKTAVVETPQGALWPIQNTTKRFVAYSKHHKALCDVLVWDLTLKTGWPVYSHISHKCVYLSANRFPAK